MLPSSVNIYFGGPDKQPYALRNILLNAIEQTPSGGHINWLCYYLNDSVIIDALIEAANRNVQITLLIDANPRISEINASTITHLLGHANLAVIAIHKKLIWEYFGLHWHPHFHCKLYYFSHPQPHVLIGSYNPTAGKDQLPQRLLSQIGDHSISHNVLVDIEDREAAKFLNQYVNKMQNNWFRKIARFSSCHNQSHHIDDWTIDFLPRIRTHPLKTMLIQKDEDVTIRCAISHLKGPGIMRALSNAIKQNKKIEILLETTERRVSKQILSFLENKGISFWQPSQPENCLMHNKFILYESSKEHRVVFGSYNWSSRSRYLNHEILVNSNNEKIVSAFEERWQQLI